MPNQTLYDNFSQVRQYIDQEKPDLSSYVTKTELTNCSYVTSADLPVINENIIPKENNTYTLGDSSYIYSTSYITDMWLNGTNKFSNRNNNQVNLMINNAWKYVFHANNFSPANDNAINLGESSVRWESTYTVNLFTNTAYLQDTSYSSSIIPKETTTYTLGDVDHLYNAAYTSRVKVGNNSQIYNDGGGITFSVNSNNGIRIGGSTFYPKTSGGYSNGSSTNLWSATYTNDLYYSGKISYISDKTKLIMNDRNIDIYANNKKLVNISDYGGFVPMQTSFNLGSSANYWGTTYTTNLYADNIHNFIWTGTSAEYASLPDYTTYQFYLITA